MPLTGVIAPSFCNLRQIVTRLLDFFLPAKLYENAIHFLDMQPMLPQKQHILQQKKQMFHQSAD